MVLFDKGSHLLASVDMHQEQSEWLYQLKNATDVPDRADAIVVLAKPKAGPEIVSALAAALNSDKAWGVRITAAEGLGRIATDAASKELLASLDTNNQPWVRSRIVSALGSFKDNAEVSAKLDAIAKDDSSYRARASALQTIARLKSPAAFSTLTAAVSSDSPDDILRDAALRSFGFLGDDKAVPLLREWSVPGKRIESRQAAIGSLARLDKNNKEITQQIASYLNESHFPVRLAAIFALGTRGDASAVPALETLLKSNDLSIEMVPMIKGQIARLQQTATGAGNRRRGANGATGSENSDEESRSADEAKAREEALARRLDHLEHLIEQMTDQLKSMESRLPPAKQ
jgi:aminopeptidase N